MGRDPTVLVLEDEVLIGMGIEQVLRRMRCRVLGPVASVAAALAVLDAEPPDAALLDLRLGRGADSLPVAAALARRGVPFAFITGAGTDSLPEHLRGHPCLPKPFRDTALAAVVDELLASQAVTAG
jgi:DNA-binding NtrC family response regulator